MLSRYQMFRGERKEAHTEYYLRRQFFTTSLLQSAGSNQHKMDPVWPPAPPVLVDFFFFCKQLESSACLSSLAAVWVACPVWQDFNYQVWLHSPKPTAKRNISMLQIVAWQSGVRLRYGDCAHRSLRFIYSLFSLFCFAWCHSGLCDIKGSFQLCRRSDAQQETSPAVCVSLASCLSGTSCLGRRGVHTACMCSSVLSTGKCVFMQSYFLYPVPYLEILHPRCILQRGQD